MVEKRYYCEKHFNVALNMGVCVMCLSERVPAFMGLSFSPSLGYLCKNVVLGITRDFTSRSQYTIEYIHKSKVYWIEQDRFDVPTEIEGEFLRMKHYFLNNGYSQDEMVLELNKIIGKFKNTCTCYACETIKVPA